MIHWTSLLLANLRGRPPRIARPTSTGERRFKHHDWVAFVQRFGQDDGVDYAQFRRVRRLLEIYLDRISEARPDEFADPDEQLAFYLNAYNAIVVYQVLLHYPVASFRDIPGAFARPYPVGRENISLHELLHAKIRAYGDPRVHAAVVAAARSDPRLRAYTPASLQTDLDEQMRAFLADPVHGLRIEFHTRTLFLPHSLRWFAGDWAAPERMPSPLMLLRGQIDYQRALPRLRPFMPPEAGKVLDKPGYHLRVLPYDGRLNDSADRSR